MPIRRLDETVIRKIAAGEVVERPSSVAKELVENALDAGSRRIELAIEAGGVALLRVDDNGVGMGPDEMRLAIERHTTSKLVTEEDLRHVRTLGFRGEALAAICAVARVRILSRPAGVDLGHEIRIEEGVVAEERPAPRPVGTTVEVRDLFWNVPARRGFLDSPAAEGRHLLSALRRIVLAQPEVAFAACSDGREVLDVPAAPGPQARIGQIYGTSFSARLIPVELDEPGVRLRAWFAPPELARPTRVDQHLFLSGRAVRPGLLSVGIAQVYNRYLPRGQHAAFFLYLDVDPELVDVNVHPRKEEVRFRSDRSVMDLVRRAAVRALGGGVAIGGWSAGPPRSYAPPPRAAAADMERPLVREPSPVVSPRRSWRVVGQAQASYILVEEVDGLEIVDQHAAHERVLFEQYVHQTALPTQEFLVPVQVEVPFDRAEALRRALPELAQIGVHLEPFGAQAFLLRGWPAPLADRQSRLGFQEPLAAVGERLLEGEAPLVELWREVACAAAIRAGEPLTPEEQEALIQSWKATDEPARCPHGRPVVVRVAWDDLAHRLGR
ncbi:MAG: DNA mismatch repair protein MutL [Candidatus Bipolaricaulis sibiricus]|uniref:DNA mismatch repair protein MutL n=1 Tax=Bipolaricaulis sibiricus TaxID=2501609 RepID=A0A410FUS1_BIPS1|nr:MAG: DNA mismatch repair protein MutL [Candidatus Bipolaricaulis sibiricus]